MSERSIPKKGLPASFALAAVIAAIFFGALSGRAIAQSNPELIPLVRIEPEYPYAALTAQREGEVWLNFTISADGTTKDVKVISSSSPEFEAPAMAAVLRWRYYPPMSNGVPSDRYDVRTIIRFQFAPDCRGAPGADPAAVPPRCPDAKAGPPKP